MKVFIGICILGLSAVAYMFFPQIEQTQLDNELAIANVEALTQTDVNPKIMYGYEMVKCYEDEKNGHQTLKKLVGQKCQPMSGGECVRTMQWGECP